MIDTKVITDLQEFFANLPRPLPSDLMLNTAEKVVDPETFLDTQFGVLEHRKDTSYGEVVLARLQQWKESYQQATQQKNLG